MARLRIHWYYFLYVSSLIHKENWVVRYSEIIELSCKTSTRIRITTLNWKDRLNMSLINIASDDVLDVTTLHITGCEAVNGLSCVLLSLPYIYTKNRRRNYVVNIHAKVKCCPSIYTYIHVCIYIHIYICIYAYVYNMEDNFYYLHEPHTRIDRATRT